MARLNEPPVIESVDSLKRRFIRQNRELARSNSTQSIKIRNLETQISQLVAENVSLRSTIIQLQTELEESRNRRISENVASVKDKLEEKLREFGGLVSELNNISKRSIKPAKSPPRSPKQSPGSKVWITASTIGDILEGREGWLPTIAEGKHFPRRTLEPTDVRGLIVNEASDSPEIGPPPRASIDGLNCEDRPLESERSDPQRPNGVADISSLCSANFETRRKRRESGIRHDKIVSAAVERSPPNDTNGTRPPELWTTQPIRAGAKRKLDATNCPRDSETPASKDKEAVFSGKRASDTSSSNGKDGRQSPVRRALAPKSVNKDPVVSPSKCSVKEITQHKLTAKHDAKENSHKLSSRKSNNLGSVRLDQISDIVQSVELPLHDVKDEPQTPAPFDLLSPVSTEPSGPRIDGRGDTPPPTDLNSRSGIGNDGPSMGRGSRRARASVNYAEPSLISKMRRPTKDLVDAVRQDQRRSTSAAMEISDLNQDIPGQNPALRTVIIGIDNRTRNESMADRAEDERPEPQSPLEKRDESSHASSDRPLDRDRRRSALHMSDATSGGNEKTGSSAAISTLIGGSLKGLNGIASAQNTSPTDVVQKSDIFDVAPSPPTTYSLAKPKEKTEPPRPKSAASARSNVNAGEKKPRESLSNPSSTSSNRPRNRRQTIDGESDASKASQSATALRASGSKARDMKYPRSAAIMGENGRSETQTTAERIAERTAARRRSMIL